MQRLDLALLEEVVDASQVFTHTAIPKLVDLIDHPIQELTVVRDNDHRTIVLHDRLLQNILRAHVHVVRRLIQHQQVARFEHHAGHCQAGTLTTREHLHLLVDILTAEQEGTQNIAQTGTNIAHSHPIQRVIDRKLAIHQIVLILGIVANIDIRTQANRPFGRGQLTNQHTRQRRLTLAIATHQGDAVALLDRKICPREDMLRPVGHADLFELGHHLTRTRCRGKFDVQVRQILLLDLHTRLHLVGFRRLIAELLDKLLGLLDHALLILVGRLLLFASLGTQDDIFRVGYLVIGDLTQRKLHRAGGHIVQKGPIVRDEQHRTVVVLQVLLQPLDRLNIEVVGRLVQQEDRGATQQQLRQLDTHTPTARELGRRTTKVASFEAQAEQRLFDIGIARLTTQQLVHLLCLIQAVQQVGIGLALVILARSHLTGHLLDLGLQAQHLLEGFAGLLDQRRRIVHAHRLRQVADRTIAIDRHGARRRCLLARNQAQQRRLTRAIATHQTDTVLRVDQKRNIIKKGPTAIRHGQIIE